VPCVSLLLPQNWGSASSMERPDVDDQETEECSEQVWNRREAARSRQIAIGKNRPEYKRYAQEVGNLRDSSMPSTPDPRSRVSKRQFDRALSDWRRRLHEYDASGTPLHSCSSSPQGVVRLRLADRLPEPRTPSTVAPCTPSSGASTSMPFSSPNSITPAPRLRSEQDDPTPSDIDKVLEPPLVSRFGGISSPIGEARPKERKSLEDAFWAVASPEKGSPLDSLPSHLQLSPGRAWVGNRGLESPRVGSSAAPGSPRTPSPRVSRLPGPACGTAGGGGKHGFVGAMRSPPPSIARTPKCGNWVTETPSPRGSHWLQQGRSSDPQQQQQHLALGAARWYNDWHAQSGIESQTAAWNMDWSAAMLHAPDAMPSLVGLPLPGVDERLANCMGALMLPQVQSATPQ